MLWERAIQAALKPRKLIQHLHDDSPSEDSSIFQRCVVGEEVVFAWLLDSIAPEQLNKFMSYDTSQGYGKQSGGVTQSLVIRPE